MAGKFLYDLGREPDVSEKDGIFTRPGGASFAVLRDGATTAIFAAESRASLEGYLAQVPEAGHCSQFSNVHKSSLSTNDTNTNANLNLGFVDNCGQFSFVDNPAGGGLVSSAACPPWMKRFGWGMYGVGGFENLHNWMDAAGAAKGEVLDPAEDFGFFAEMGSHGESIHFDNWLDGSKFDFSDGILEPGWRWRARHATTFRAPSPGGCRKNRRR